MRSSRERERNQRAFASADSSDRSWDTFTGVLYRRARDRSLGAARKRRLGGMSIAVRPLTLLVLLFLAFAARAQDGDASGVVVIRGARIFTVADGVIERGTVVMRGGKIAAVGPVDEVAVPDGATVVDGSGRVVVPGLVDTHSHLGVYARPRVVANSDGNESTGPVQSLVRAIDSIYPRDPGIRQGVAGGVTTANIMPGSANVMGGQTAYVKLRGKTVAEMLIDLGDGPPGMKMANGENPKRSYGGRGKAPATRMKVMALQRGIFLKAQRYQEKRAKDPDHPRDLALEPVVEILEGRRTVHFHTHRADDIMSALRLRDEFGFELVLQHATEAYLVADEIAKRGVACSHTIVDSPGGKPEALNLRFETPGETAAAGIVVAVNTDDPVTESRFFLRTAALCVRGGMKRTDALKAVTLNAARMMHLEDRVGSIEPGKDADVVLLSGDPFSVYTRVLGTWIEGVRVFDRADERDLRHATGGHHVRERMRGRRYGPTPRPAPARDPQPDAAWQTGDEYAVHAGALFDGEQTRRDVYLHVRDGKVVSVGAEPPPEGIAVMGSAWVVPGLVDAHASAGLSGAMNVPADQDLQERAKAVHADLRALDGFNPRERLVRYLLAHGIVAVHAVPGPRPVVAGQAGVFTTYGDTAAEATVKFPSALVFNLGESAKRRGGAAPGTRMGVAAVIRKALSEALQRKPKRSGDGDGDEDEHDGDRDGDAFRPGRAVLRACARGELPALFVAHREDDLLTALRLADEFGLSVALSQATEGYLVADELKAAGAPVLAAPTMQRAGGLQTFNTTLENAARLADAGVPVAITSGYESYVPKTRVVLFEAGVAAANGLGHERALRAVTSEPARLLGIDDRFGALKSGMPATFACFDGDPLEYATHCVRVVAAGRVVHRR